MLILLIKIFGLDYERLCDSQEHTSVYRKDRRESEFSPACSGVSQSPERWGRCDHCLVTAQHCNQSGAHAGKWCLAT